VWVIPTLLSKLFEIIDNMMTLSSELQSSLESKIKQFEEERTMLLMSNMEHKNSFNRALWTDFFRN